MRRSNFFITGDKGIGKSTLLKEMIETLQIKEDLSGFFTMPYFEDQVRKGFYLHSLLDIQGNDQPISVQNDEYSCEAIKETFETLGVLTLSKSLESSKNHILMDELGVLEGAAYLFQKQVEEVLNSPKIILGVLKDKKHPFLEGIKTRQDTYIYYLTKENREEIKHQISQDYLSRFSNK